MRQRFVRTASVAGLLLTAPAFALAAESAPKAAPADLVRAILGLLAIFVLAYLGGHPRVRAFEQRIGISQAVTTGLPFVALGLLARHPAVGILSDDVLAAIRPLLPLGLGWIGFTVGFRFDARILEAMPPGTGGAVALTTVLPFVAITLACGGVLLVAGPAIVGPTGEPTFLRDAMLLAAAGAVTARSATGLLPEPVCNTDRLARIIQLDQIAAVVGLLFAAAFFRPHGPVVGWQLPGTAWIFVTLGLATAIGVLVYALLASYRAGAELTVVLLGAIALTAGMASFLRLSAVVVCVLAGVLLANFPGSWKLQVRGALTRLERPVYLVFLVLVGALWHLGDWQGWALMVVFVATRFAAKWLATVFMRREGLGALTPAEHRALGFAPMGSLAVAIIVNAQDLYFDRTINWLVTAIVGGLLVTEVVVQFVNRHANGARTREV